MERAVRRDEHKMHAFVRFRACPGPAGVDEYVAWHRPDHPIVQLAAPFFVRPVPRHALDDPHARRLRRAGTAQTSPFIGVSPSRPPRPQTSWKTFGSPTTARSSIPPASSSSDAKGDARPPLGHACPRPRIIEDLLQRRPARVEEMMKRQQFRRAAPAASAAGVRPGSIHDLPPLAAAAQPPAAAAPSIATPRKPSSAKAPPTPQLMFVGEQPGDQEDLAGKPFVGPSGQLLDEVMQEVGIPRDRSTSPTPSNISSSSRAASAASTPSLTLAKSPPAAPGWRPRSTRSNRS